MLGFLSRRGMSAYVSRGTRDGNVRTVRRLCHWEMMKPGSVARTSLNLNVNINLNPPNLRLSMI